MQISIYTLSIATIHETMIKREINTRYFKRITVSVVYYSITMFTTSEPTGIPPQQPHVTVVLTCLDEALLMFTNT